MAERRTEFSYHNIQLYKSESLGSGSFGGVCKAKCDGLLCAAKIMHPALFDLRDPGTVSYLRKFQEECNLLSLARHPNVVQYLGTYTDPDTQLPVLLMELCDESLTAFLERSPGPLSYHIQVNICHDIALALVYLHSNGLIHRDLTGNNVLMVAGPRVKITDFGMSKLATFNPRKRELTMCPGNVLYMSPEALDEAKTYTAKLDIFSFGVIVIQILTRQFPDPTARFQLNSIDGNMREGESEIRVVVPETERRKAHLQLIPDTHSLKPPALQCLKRETQRPSALQLCERLSELKQSSQYGESREQAQSSNKIQRLMLQLQVKMREQQTRIAELEHITYYKDRQLQEKEWQLQENDRHLQQNQHEIATMDQTFERKEREMEQLVSEFRESLQQKDKTITDFQMTVSESNVLKDDGASVYTERQIKQSEKQQATTPLAGAMPCTTTVHLTARTTPNGQDLNQLGKKDSSEPGSTLSCQSCISAAHDSKFPLVNFCASTPPRPPTEHMLLSLRVFYHNHRKSSFVVVTRNLESHIQAVERKYAGAIRVDEISMLCDKNTDEITFSVPPTNPGGWNISPVFKPPVINTRLIQEYREGEIPPCVQFTMSWTGKGEPQEGNIEIRLEGGSIKSFTLFCNHPPPHQPTSMGSSAPIGLPKLVAQPKCLPTLQNSLPVSREPSTATQTSSCTMSPEALSLRKSYKVFTDGVDPNLLAKALFSDLLLTSKEKERARHKTYTDDEKLEEIYKALERRVSVEPRDFHTIVQVLIHAEPALRAVGEKLQGIYHELTTKQCHF